MKEYDLIGDVGYDITAQQVSSMLAMANGEDITFYIASLGGALDHGITIHGLIKKYNGNTRGVLIGNTASAGTVIGMGCDKLDANASAPFLIHNSSDPEGGNAETLIKKAGQLKRHDALMVSIYKAKTKLPESTIKSLMQKEDWLTPAEAKSYGFIDSVITAKYKAVAYHSENKL